MPILIKQTIPPLRTDVSYIEGARLVSEETAARVKTLLDELEQQGKFPRIDRSIAERENLPFYYHAKSGKFKYYKYIRVPDANDSSFNHDCVSSGPNFSEGAFSKVRYGFDLTTGQPIIIKSAMHIEVDPSLSTAAYEQEAKNAKCMNNPLLGWGHREQTNKRGDQRDQYIFAQPYIDGEDLFYVLGKKILRGRAYFDIIIQCAEIFISLHKQGLVHCDIKIENVIHDLVKQISTVVDPGSLLDKAELEWNKPVSIRGSSVNISPENIDLHMRTGKMKFNPATDMYGFGTLCIDLLGTKILMPINDGVIMPHVDPTIKLPSEIEFAKIALKTKLHLKDVNDPLITEIISETNSMVDLEQCRPSWEEVLIFFKQKREEYLTRHPLEKFRPIILLDVNNNNDISVTKDVLKGFKLGTYEVWLVDSNSRSSEIDQKHIDLYLSLKRGNIPVTRDIFLSDEGNLPGLLSHVRSTETNDNYIYAYFHWTSDKSMRVDGIKTILLQPDKRQKDYQSEFWNYLESLPVRENLAPLNSLENHPLPAAAPVAAAPSIELFSDRVNNLFKPILDNEELNLSDEIKRLLAMLEMALYTRTEQFSQEEERQDFFDNYIVPLMNNIQKMLLEIQNSSKQNSLQIINNCRMTVIQLRSSEKSAWSCICCLFSSKGNNYCEKEIGELIKKLAQEAKGKNTEDAPLIPNVDPYSSPPF